MHKISYRKRFAQLALAAGFVLAVAFSPRIHYAEYDPGRVLPEGVYAISFGQIALIAVVVALGVSFLRACRASNSTDTYKE